MLKEWITAKALTEAFKFGLRGDYPEQIAINLEAHLDKFMGTERSEDVQASFEAFLIDFSRRIVRKLREDRKAV